MIFISHSYSKEDRETVTELKERLDEEQLRWWSDETIEKATQDKTYLSDKLLQAISESRACIFVATHKSVQSLWCNAELGAFWAFGIRVFIYLTDPSVSNKLPRQLDGYFKFKNTDLPTLIDAVKNHLKKKEEFSGQWYGAHLSRDEDGTHAISVHTYDLSCWSTTDEISGTVIDSLSVATFESKVHGKLTSDKLCVLKIQPEAKEHWLFALQIHYKLSPQKANVGVITSIDRNGKPFTTYIVLMRRTFEQEEFKAAIDDQIRTLPLIINGAMEDFDSWPAFPEKKSKE